MATPLIFDQPANTSLPARLVFGGNGGPEVAAGTRLIFSKPANNALPVRLVFGDDGAAPELAATVVVAGQLSGLRGRVPVLTVPELRAVGRVTGLRGHIHIAQGAVAQVQGQLSGLRGRVGLVRGCRALVQGRLSGLRGAAGLGWDVNVSRPTVGSVRQHWQDAQPAQTMLLERFQQSQPLHAQVQQGWHDAQPAFTALRAMFDQAQPLFAAVQLHGAQALPLAATPLTGGFEQAQQLRAALHSWFDDGIRIGRGVRAGFEETIRLRGGVSSAFTDGQRLQAGVLSSFRHGQSVGLWLHSRYQQAIKPGPGRYRPPVVPPVDTRCYVPGLPMRLLFSADDYLPTLPARLVFRCPLPQPPGPVAPQYLIPLLSIYMTVHTLTAHLLPTLEPVVLKDVTITTGADAYCWSLSANGPAHLLEQLTPVGGLPPRISVTIDGISFVFAITSVSRNRAFGKWAASVQGESTTALLTAPYLPVQTWLGQVDATAQQIATEALAYTDVTLDWQIPDWLVPAGAWSYQGTPLQAVLRVAESVGAVVSSHRTAERLIITPRYPHLPWEWASATPDVQMPAAVIVTDSLQPQPRPAFNAVRVLGGAVGGIQGDVVRQLSARDKSAPQVQDNLITDQVAARQRGGVVLAASGNKLQQVINMPVLTGGTNPGILQPGQLLEVADTDGTWRGLVRGVSISASMPKVRQQVTVERIAA